MSAAIAAVGLRGAGVRYSPPPAPPPRRQLSARARSIGLETLKEAWAEHQAQTGGEEGIRLNDREIAWSKGEHWVCCVCEREFVSPTGAGRHMRREMHPVLRWLEVYDEIAAREEVA